VPPWKCVQSKSQGRKPPYELPEIVQHMCVGYPDCRFEIELHEHEEKKMVRCPFVEERVGFRFAGLARRIK